MTSIFEAEQVNVDAIKPIDAMHAIYLDWVNNYLSTDKMAADYGLNVDTIGDLIDRGRMIHENRNKPKRVRLDGGVMTSRSAMYQ